MTEAAETSRVLVRANRRGVGRSYGLVLTGRVLLLVAISLPFGIPVLLSPPGDLDLRMISSTVVLVVLYVRALWGPVRDWWRMRRIEVPIEMDDRLLVVHTPTDEVAVPWEAVESIVLGGGSLAPQSLHFVVWSDDEQSTWLRWGKWDRPSSGHWRKRAVTLNVAALDRPPTEVAAEIRRCSAGRVEVRWVS